MVEVLFGESEAGSMKIAKSTQNPEDSYKVICLGFMMDIGDIKESVNSQYRKDLISVSKRSDLLHVCTGSVGRR